jgi:hypothetical protein
MDRINEAIALHRRRDADGARRLFTEVWDEISPDGDAFHRCVLAHYMADAQDDLREELLWDLRALDAAHSVTDERAKAHHTSLSIEGFYPSLHVNLAEDYRRLGDQDRARAHLALAEKAEGALGDDGYGITMREVIAQLGARLA